MSAPRWVLVVDDNAHNVEYARQVLVDVGWAVRVAHGGREALELLRAGELAGGGPALVLLDLSMPDVDGWEVARRVRLDGAPPPLVACTAHAMRGDRERALASGFDGYLAKPYRPAELLECVASFLGAAPGGPGASSGWELDGPLDDLDWEEGAA